MIELTDNIKVFNEDCMITMSRYPDKYFDLAIVDPPYGIKRFKNGIGKNDRHKVKSNSMFNNNVPDDVYFKELFRLSANQIIWGANNFILPPSEYFCIWNKKQTVTNFASAEYAWCSPGLKSPAKVFEYSIHKHNHLSKMHPTQKPVALYTWLLENYSKSDMKIIDTHLGSGSSAIASHRFGIKEFIGIELDTDYFNSFIDRFKKECSSEDMFAYMEPKKKTKSESMDFI